MHSDKPNWEQYLAVENGLQNALSSCEAAYSRLSKKENQTIFDFEMAALLANCIMDILNTAAYFEKGKLNGMA